MGPVRGRSAAAAAARCIAICAALGGSVRPACGVAAGACPLTLSDGDVRTGPTTGSTAAARRRSAAPAVPGGATEPRAGAGRAEHAAQRRHGRRRGGAAAPGPWRGAAAPGLARQSGPRGSVASTRCASRGSTRPPPVVRDVPRRRNACRPAAAPSSSCLPPWCATCSCYRASVTNGSTVSRAESHCGPRRPARRRRRRRRRLRRRRERWRLAVDLARPRPAATGARRGTDDAPARVASVMLRGAWPRWLVNGRTSSPRFCEFDSCDGEIIFWSRSCAIDGPWRCVRSSLAAIFAWKSIAWARSTVGSSRCEGAGAWLLGAGGIPVGAPSAMPRSALPGASAPAAARERPLPSLPGRASGASRALRRAARSGPPGTGHARAAGGAGVARCSIFVARPSGRYP